MPIDAAAREGVSLQFFSGKFKARFGGRSQLMERNMRSTRIERRDLRRLKEWPDNPRVHPPRQVRRMRKIIRELGFIGTLVVDEHGVILAGHLRRVAALAEGIVEADCVVVEGLSEAEKRAFILADNKLGLGSTWDIERVQLMLDEIVRLDVDLDLSLTGFDAAEIDQLKMDLAPEEKGPSPRDEAMPELRKGPAVSRRGDIIRMGTHRLVCGDSRDPETFRTLMGREQAAIVISDAPYNLGAKQIGGNGRIKHPDFEMGVGEMGRSDFTAFLAATVANAVTFCRDGAIHFYFMDWRHMREILDAGEQAGLGLKNLVVWDKMVGGQGSFYRSQHELIFCFRQGDAPHQNNFGLGEGGRYRTNVWKYPGLNTGGKGRLESLAMHPTVKPVEMLADALIDCSTRGDIVLDFFAGSGSTLIAAHKTGRRARLIEIDPHYVDIIVRRWEVYAQDDAIFEDTGETFRERQERRAQERMTVRPGRTPTSRVVYFPGRASI
jgi:DNA modification methylase